MGDLRDWGFRWQWRLKVGVVDAECVLQSARDNRRDKGAVMPCTERREECEEWRDAQGNEQRWEMAMRERSSDGRERERERERKKCAERRKVNCLEVNSIFLCIEKYCSLPRE
jgi:hypothetical protein